ncbi:Threonine/homoserine/homoserine lactone efflux protein [Gracilibacillus ureilyticus]|uniref:Threonine/homoserine/homoserine lactone efflux protein n=1 Tax=Gracilibacillus ureilyticus TaxID=531814 RepID=A0A1H9QMV8_9BACI|nr:LysE family transporter [Gracilibacillus ureilyticus]SER61750.1 Threonine/homoserine/homoserine lactone efflux protein [Gracilibacillus ureilyticus]
MAIFLSYIFLGLSLAAPIGPLNAAQINQGIKNGFLHSWTIAIGALFAEMFFILAVFLGLVHFLETPFVKTFLWSFGAFVLFYTGIESIYSSQKIEMNHDREKDSLLKTFTSGFLITISNPLSILFWLGIYGSVLANTINKYDHLHLLLYTFAIILGLIIWDFTMALVSSGFRHFLTNRTLKVISVTTGISLIGFAVYFGYQAFQLLFS